MAYFNRDDRGRGDRGGFRGDNKRGFGERDRERTAMFQAICSSCHKSCEVPFKPSGDKPVYCRDCFAGRAAMGGDRSRRPDPRKLTHNFAPNTAYGAQPRMTSQNNTGNEELKKQLEGINIKLERLIVSVQALSQNSLSSFVVEKPKSLPKSSGGSFKKTLTAKIAAKISAKKNSKKK